MKLIRFLVIMLLLLLVAVCGIWFYVTKHIADEINNKYAGEKFSALGIDSKEYFITFDKVSPSGFPFKISWDVSGWSEESRAAKIHYSSPVQLGYDLLLQEVFVSYNGEIISAYKPEKNGFGSRLKIKNYKIKVDLPLSAELVQTLKNMTDPVSLINHLGEVNISSGKVEIFDLINDEKFYDKEYEQLKLTFIPQKQYENVEDMLSHIPQHYTADYAVKIHPTDVAPRRLPVSLFYGFSVLPSGLDIEASAVIKTKGNNLNDIARGLDFKGDITCESQLFKLRNLKLDYKATDESLNMRDYTLDTSSKLHVKAGMFDTLFSNYGQIRSTITSSPVGKLVDKEIQYIINHRDQFKFKDLENSDYDFHLKTSSVKEKNKVYTKIDDFSIFSDDSGIKLQHQMDSAGNNWNANGLLYIKNYPAVVDFTSAYIYRFGKFRFLSEEARELYVDVNTEFLKSISDHPESTSDDLSFEYKINSQNLNKAKIGSVGVEQIAQLYTLRLYQKLFGKVGTEGDVLSRMQKIIPNINPNDPILKQILPKISGGEAIEKSTQEHLRKLVPSEAQDVINKIIPKDALKKKNLLKNLLQQ